jgi:hypothetical protein
MELTARINFGLMMRCNVTKKTTTLHFKSKGFDIHDRKRIINSLENNNKSKFRDPYLVLDWVYKKKGILLHNFMLTTLKRYIQIIAISLEQTYNKG